MTTDQRATLRELRRTRARRRLGDVEWYDVAYRAYLFALVGLIVVVTVSDAIDGVVGDEVDTGQLLAVGPSILGLAVVVAAALGLRSGAEGGPVSVELADIRHVLLAPVRRRTVLLRPVGQRFRSLAFALALVGGVLGQLVATELDGSCAAWAAGGVLFGAMTGATFVGAAVLSHALRVPRWAATALGGGLLAWQGVAAWRLWNDEITDAATTSTDGGASIAGPADLHGRIALWGVEQHPVDALAIAGTAAVVVSALLFCGRLRIEPLARRGELVSQLRFAATVQDIRTVVLLRRQLRSERLRSTPWLGRTGGRRRVAPSPVRGPARPRRAASPAVTGSVVWQRGLRSLRRLPLARLGRIAATSAIGGVAAALTVTSSPLFGLLVLAAVFVVGLESLEPLSQEVDRPDLTDRLPVERGWIYAHLLLAPASLLAVAALIGAAAGSIVDPAAAAGLFAVAVPVAVAGAVGPVVATVTDAPAAMSSTTLFGSPRHAESTLMPPEFAGFGTIARTLLPMVLSAAGLVPVYAMRVRADPATAVRSWVGVALFVAGVLWWVRRRDAWGANIRHFFEQGRAAA